MLIPSSRIVALQGRIPKAELGRLYKEECLSVIEIAQKLGVMDHEVINLLTAYGILGRYDSRSHKSKGQTRVRDEGNFNVKCLRKIWASSIKRKVSLWETSRKSSA